MVRRHGSGRDRSSALVLAGLLTATVSVMADAGQVDLEAPVPERPFNEQTVGEMCAALRSEDAQRQYDAARYLYHETKEWRWSPSALDCLLHAVEHGAIQPVQATASYALRPHGAAAVPGLLEIWERKHHNNAYWVTVSALDTLGPEATAAESVMLAWMVDERAPFAKRLDAAKIVWSIGNEPHRDHAYETMLELFATADARTRGFAAFAIARTGRPEGITYLARCGLGHEEAHWRQACVTELGNIATGHRESYDPADGIRWLEQMRDDPDEEVRRKVEVFLQLARSVDP